MQLPPIPKLTNLNMFEIILASNNQIPSSQNFAGRSKTKPHHRISKQ